jgi:hypothetical protein
MIKFNPENKDKLEFEEIFDPASKIQNKGEAKQYLYDYADYICKRINSSSTFALDYARFDLNYYSDYYGKKTSLKMQKIFEIEDPFLDDLRPIGLSKSEYIRIYNDGMKFVDEHPDYYKELVPVN